MPAKFEGDTAVKNALFEKTAIQNGKLGGIGETFAIPADMVLKAIGQKLEEATFLNLKLVRGKIEVDSNFQTSIPGVFAGGDCIVSGQDLTVQAVEDGKRAAIAADRYVRGT
jgi:glutamate synthase (NADPH/NADH) small chain